MKLFSSTDYRLPLLAETVEWEYLEGIPTIGNESAATDVIEAADGCRELGDGEQGGREVWKGERE